MVWGTHAFLQKLNKSGDGHVINTSSLFGLLASPTQGTYNTSKFAVRGFTESLRQELDLMKCGVSATCIHPGGIRTEIARTARMDASMDKHTKGKAEQARAEFDKVLNFNSAESAALQILKGVARNKRRVLVGPDAKFMDLLVRLLGSWYQPITTWGARRMMKI